MSYSLTVSNFSVANTAQAGAAGNTDGNPAQGTLLELSGELDFTSVPLAFKELESHIDRPQSLRIDLKSVQRANSAALALLIECRSRVATAGGHLEIANIPDSVNQIAEVCGVSTILHGA